MKVSITASRHPYHAGDTIDQLLDESTYGVLNLRANLAVLEEIFAKKIFWRL
jgi:hypothetical protein